MALCTGATMVGAAVYGLVGVDQELQRSSYAAQESVIKEQHDLRVIDKSDCPAAEPHTTTRL